MRKVLLVWILALGVAGCAASGGAPQVRDLSVSRDKQPGDTVTVKAGDTLYGIAWRQSMDFRQLARLNNLKPPYRLQPGQTLRLVPGATATTSTAAVASNSTQGSSVSGVTTVQNPDWLAPDTAAIERNQGLSSRPLNGSSGTNGAAPSGQALSGAAVAGGASAPGPIYNYDTPGAGEPPAANPPGANRQVASAGTTAGSSAAGASADTTVSSSSGNTTANGGDTRVDAGTAVAGEPADPEAQQRTFTPVEDIPWQWPTEGQLVGRFDDGSDITAGIDIAGQKGQPVKAAGPGIVVYAGDGVRGYGNLILLKHNDRFLSAYAHNDSLTVEENDVVRAGEVIATMGNTDADSVKLHFEVRKDGQPQDPLEVLPPR
ncbi:lipoprotein NlpD [Modicisalibacter muralis]|uniref:Lipoprotein NlpD n=1 Tax=Modicisalibacter muralis TaxID=119000 RepID=A0A1G9P279_9GAMM|nr:peptidoglycan DD-metalloendopeptidase family protein [Halomonas muralis]SDL92740.1 lipoprotein NlpD [Halomonas muralis]